MGQNCDFVRSYIHYFIARCPKIYRIQELKVIDFVTDGVNLTRVESKFSSLIHAIYDILAAKPRRRGVKWRDIMHFKHCTYVTN